VIIIRKWHQVSLIILWAIILLIIILGSQTIFSVSQTSEPMNEEEVKVKLLEIEAESLLVIEELFGIEQSMNAAQKNKSEIALAIENKKEQVVMREKEILEEELIYEQHLLSLEKILTTYQRMGPTSMLGIILQADSLKDFVRRIAVIRDFTRHSEVLMSQIKGAIVDLESSKEKLAQEQVELEVTMQEYEQAIVELTKLQEDKERYLVSLEEERLSYEEQLKAITDAWKQAKPVFKEASIGFSELVDSGALTEDMIEVDISFLGVKATILDSKFNQAIKDYDKLPDMVFLFQEGNVTISLLEGILVLQGEFQIKEDFKLNYVAKSGVFYGVPLEQSSLVELFEEGELILDIRELTLNNKVKNIEIQDGKMILDIAFSLFGE